ncbi:Imm1 family immunity protein [Actinokineospora iranica]|uniref:Imm1 family immunity protein n=1 Tax=Actinokineospora iranica TaxID=1271860 RepID=UPI001587271B|nr:Imm1 family immunity protein [Actinokineospora iranica]
MDVAAEVRALNSAGVQVPWLWEFSRDRQEINDPQPILTAGVHNAVGVLEWREGEDVFVPVSGGNAHWLDYAAAGLRSYPVRPCAEVPVEMVHAAIAEFVSTGSRPTCVEWRGEISIFDD